MFVKLSGTFYNISNIGANCIIFSLPAKDNVLYRLNIRLSSDHVAINQIKYKAENVLPNCIGGVGGGQDRPLDARFSEICPTMLQ